jgi:hypothetical protein
MAKQPGSIWVEGVQLHYIASDGAEWYVQGDYWGSAAGRPGSLWVSTSDAYLYYSGADGLKYRVPLVWPHSDGNAQKGVWVEGHFLSWAVNGGKFQAAFSHNDGGASGHVDSPHSDGHTDGSHGDSHGDGHTDTPHSDGSHVDTGHTDAHYDMHGDYPMGGSSYGYHWDCSYQTNGVVTSHLDHTDHAAAGITYCQWHDDAHSDAAHADASHGDAAHSDSHNDQAHTDSSHGDTHLDSGHADHTDGATGGHVDQPIYVGP